MRRGLLALLLLAAAHALSAGGATEREAERAPARADLLIRQDILDRLAWDARVEAVFLDAVVREGQVVLLGSTATAAGREAAEADVRDLPGVRSVDNRLEVRARPAAVPDEVIGRQVRMILDWLPEIEDRTDVVVFVINGAVILQGQTEALWKKERIGQVAALPAGVARVINEVAVVPAVAVGDDRITRDIQAELARAAPETAGRVAVEVAGGRVTLSGTLPSAAARRAAREAALYCRGVVALDDRLLVER